MPAAPQLYCDDVTPEKLGSMLADQGGRMLQASPEGAAFEIAKGRYAAEGKGGVFEVYLKGHAGDSLRVNRVGRPPDTIDNPALSVALAVQPDVIRGLAGNASLKARGFLGASSTGSPPRSSAAGRSPPARSPPASCGPTATS